MVLTDKTTKHLNSPLCKKAKVESSLPKWSTSTDGPAKQVSSTSTSISTKKVDATSTSTKKHGRTKHRVSSTSTLTSTKEEQSPAATNDSMSTDNASGVKLESSTLKSTKSNTGNVSDTESDTQNTDPAHIHSFVKKDSDCSSQQSSPITPENASSNYAESNAATTTPENASSNYAESNAATTTPENAFSNCAELSPLSVLFFGWFRIQHILNVRHSTCFSCWCFDTQSNRPFHCGTKARTLSEIWGERYSRRLWQ